MNVLDHYLERSEFESYEDFSKNFSLHVPEDFDYARDVVDYYAKEAPDKLAILYCDDHGTTKKITFGEVSALSKKAASWFLKIGVHKGSRVLTLLRRRWEYWICAVALHRIGAVVVPASIQLMTKDIVHRINNANATTILAVDDEFVMEQLAPLSEDIEHMVFVGDRPAPDGFYDFHKGLESAEEWNEYSGLSNTDPMLIYFTSGTSGYPKMAIHNRTYPLGHIITAKYMQRVLDDGLHLTQADSGWAKFGWGNIYGQWICGSAILAYDPERFHADRLLEVLEEFAPTSLCIPPTMYRFLLKAGLEQHHVKSIHWFSTAGEALSGEVNETFHSISGHYIHEGFGQSEGTPISCSFEWFDVRPSSMGKPSPLYDVRLIDTQGNECKQGEHGEVVIFTKEETPVGLLTAYGLNGVLESPIVNGVYHTGDIAYADEDGYLWYDGRNDDMIKCSGYRIGPFEIESILNTHPAVKESAVVGREDEIRGQVVCAVVVLEKGFTPSEALTKELQSHVKTNTAPYKYPRVVEYVSNIPKTTSGKIIRKAFQHKRS